MVGKAGPRLWRATNPNLPEAERQRLVSKLMEARRTIRSAEPGSEALAHARKDVHSAKVALGERGAPWWTDGDPDYNRHLVRNTPYAAWWSEVEG
nr:hypothetical protein [Sphingomonas sinipercae]